MITVSAFEKLGFVTKELSTSDAIIYSLCESGNELIFANNRYEELVKQKYKMEIEEFYDHVKEIILEGSKSKENQEKIILLSCLQIIQTKLILHQIDSEQAQ